jgi:hypothetical protein
MAVNNELRAEIRALRAEKEALRATLAEVVAAVRPALERIEARIHELPPLRSGPFSNANTGPSGPNMSIGNVAPGRVDSDTTRELASPLPGVGQRPIANARSNGSGVSPVARNTRERPNSPRPTVGRRAGLSSPIIGASDAQPTRSLLGMREASGTSVSRDRGRSDRAQHFQANTEPSGSTVDAAARVSPRSGPPMLSSIDASRRPDRGRGSHSGPHRRSPRPRSTQPDRTTDECSHGGPPPQQRSPSDLARPPPRVPMSQQLRGANIGPICPRSGVTNADVRRAARAQSLQHKAAINDDAPVHE